MDTIYDWLTIALFASLIVLFLQRSNSDEPKDSLWHYLVAGVGFAIVNQLGNYEMHIIAIAALALVLAFVQFTLKPFEGWKV